MDSMEDVVRELILAVILNFGLRSEASVDCHN